MDVAFSIELLVFFVLLGFSAFFSSLETALFAPDSVRIEKVRADRNLRVLPIGEMTPKTLAIRDSAAFAIVQSGPTELFARLIVPIRRVVRAFADLFTTLVVGAERSPGNIVTEDRVCTLARELYRKRAERAYLVSGRTGREGLSDDLGFELPSASYSTLVRCHPA